MIVDAEILLAIAAIITAAGGFYKNSVDVRSLKRQIEDQATTIKKQGERIACLEAENVELKTCLDKATEENKELKDQNQVLLGVNEEYRKQLLPHIRNK